MPCYIVIGTTTFAFLADLRQWTHLTSALHHYFTHWTIQITSWLILLTLNCKPQEYTPKSKEGIEAMPAGNGSDGFLMTEVVYGAFTDHFYKFSHRQAVYTLSDFNDIMLHFYYCPVIVDCGPLDDPANGGVLLLNTTTGSSAVYRCDDGFTINGTDVRICQSSGQWSGEAPVCDRDRKSLNCIIHRHAYIHTHTHIHLYTHSLGCYL